MLICTLGSLLDRRGRQISLWRMRNIGTAVPQDHLVSHGRRLQIDDCKQPHLRIDPMRGCEDQDDRPDQKGPGQLAEAFG